MPEESGSAPMDERERFERREARRREERWWRGGLIAAVVLLAIATLYNGASYRRLARSQQHLVMTIAQQSQRGFGPMGQRGPGPMGGPPMWRGFGGQMYGAPMGPWAFRWGGGCGPNAWHHHEQGEQEPGGDGHGAGPNGPPSPPANE
jgi:hypothetical protein